MGPNWCLLPPELLQAIAEKVTSLADYMRFRAVCHPWRSASSPRPRHLPIQLPWLMLPYKPQGNGGSTRLFYDLSTSKIHRLDLPETYGAAICGSSHGWLVLHKVFDRVTFLFNPITRATISLPRYTTPPTIVIVKKAILTSSPLDTSCMVFVFTSSLLWELAFCKIGDQSWTAFQANFPTDFCTGGDIRDISYSNGFLYTVNGYGSVTKYDLINPSKMVLGGGMGSYHMFLVNGVDGDVLLISPGRQTYGGVVEREYDYRVFKLSNDEEPKWIDVNDVGKNVLFLGGGRHALSLSSANLQLPGWGANCLYYDSQGTHQLLDRISWYDNNIKLARLDNGTIIDVIGDLGSFQLNGHWQNSLWLTPSLL